MKRASVAAIIWALLVSTLTALQPVNSASAQSDALVEPPAITIVTPENEACATNNITLSFNVSVGKSLQDIYYVHLDSLCYKGDWQQNETLVGYKYADGSGWYYAAGDFASFSFNLTEIPEGNRSILIYAREIVAFPHIGFTTYDSSKIVNFTVDVTEPSVSVMSPEAKEYGASDIILNFTVNESFSQIAYSLDDNDNVKVAGNTTLSGLSGGGHTVKVYAWDEAGNVGASEAVTFTVVDFFQVGLVIAIIVTVVVVVTGLLFYFRKRKR